MLLQMALFHSFYGWVVFHCVCILHLLYPFICSWTFKCFRVFVIVNSAAMNIQVHISFQIIVLSGYMPSSVVAGSYGNSTFSFFRNLSILFSIVAALIYIPTNSVGEFPFQPLSFFYLIHGLSRSVLLNFQEFRDFPDFFCY